MRILALSYWWPEPADNGSRLRISQLLRAIGQEHEVHLVAFAQEPVTPEQEQRLTEICASVSYVPQQIAEPMFLDRIGSLWSATPASVRANWSSAFEQLVYKRAAAIRPDLVLSFELGVAPYAQRVVGVPKILDELQLNNIRGSYLAAGGKRRLRALVTWLKHRAFVRSVLRDFTACSVVSQAEQELVRANVSGRLNVVVIPNGADVVERMPVVPEADTLIYPGALSFDANLDAMQFFTGSIFPLIRRARPSVKLRITGKSTSEQRAALPTVEGVEFTGFLPDVRDKIAHSWAEVVPLRQGGGTRLKILEALAIGTPVVSTTKGVEGLDLRDGVDLLIADTPDAFAARTLQLLAAPELRAGLVEHGYRAVREKYDWRVIGRRMIDLIADTQQRHPAGLFRGGAMS